MSRFVMAGRVSSKRISVPESVTARLNLRRIVSASSMSVMLPWTFSSDFDIFFDGSSSAIIFAPTFGMKASGSRNVSSKSRLKRSAMSRVNSKCCFWSWPTGTRSVW